MKNTFCLIPLMVPSDVHSKEENKGSIFDTFCTLTAKWTIRELCYENQRSFHVAVGLFTYLFHEL